jgi:hypothetical protein
MAWNVYGEFSYSTDGADRYVCDVSDKVFPDPNSSDCVDGFYLDTLIDLLKEWVRNGKGSGFFFVGDERFGVTYNDMK